MRRTRRQTGEREIAGIVRELTGCSGEQSR